MVEARSLSVKILGLLGAFGFGGVVGRIGPIVVFAVVAMASQCRDMPAAWWVLDLAVAGIVGAMALPELPGGNGPLIGAGLMLLVLIGRAAVTNPRS